MSNKHTNKQSPDSFSFMLDFKDFLLTCPRPSPPTWRAQSLPPSSPFGCPLSSPWTRDTRCPDLQMDASSSGPPWPSGWALCRTAADNRKDISDNQQKQEISCWSPPTLSSSACARSLRARLISAAIVSTFSSFFTSSRSLCGQMLYQQRHNAGDKDQRSDLKLLDQFVLLHGSDELQVTGGQLVALHVLQHGVVWQLWAQAEMRGWKQQRNRENHQRCQWPGPVFGSSVWKSKVLLSSDSSGPLEPVWRWRCSFFIII